MVVLFCQFRPRSKDSGETGNFLQLHVIIHSDVIDFLKLEYNKNVCTHAPQCI